MDIMDLVRALPASVAQGLIWGVMAIGVYLTFKILDFADLSVDGSLALGGAVAVVSGNNEATRNVKDKLDSGGIDALTDGYEDLGLKKLSSISKGGNYGNFEDFELDVSNKNMISGEYNSFEYNAPNQIMTKQKMLKFFYHILLSFLV